MVHESINRLKELNTELGEAYNRQVEKLKTHYEGHCEGHFTAPCSAEWRLLVAPFIAMSSDGRG